MEALPHSKLFGYFGGLLTLWGVILQLGRYVERIAQDPYFVWDHPRYHSFLVLGIAESVLHLRNRSIHLGCSEQGSSKKPSGA